VKDHKRRILATVCRAAVPPNEADDAAQEALLAIPVSLKSWDATGWPAHANGGRIGVGSYDIVKEARLDDFGGG